MVSDPELLPALGQELGVGRATVAGWAEPGTHAVALLGWALAAAGAGLMDGAEMAADTAISMKVTYIAPLMVSLLRPESS